jgi:tetratricopeptide (TPR) repeat protein
MLLAAAAAVLLSGTYLWADGQLQLGRQCAILLGLGGALLAAGYLLLSAPGWLGPAGRELPAQLLAEPFLRSARTALEEGQLAVALTLCQRALEVDGHNVAALLEIARIYAARHDDLKALEHYRRVLDRLGAAGRHQPAYRAARDGIAEIVARHPARDQDLAGDLPLKR